MSSKILTIRPQIKKNHRSYKIDLYCAAPISAYLTRSEIKEMIESGWKLNIDITSDQLKNADKRNLSERDICLRLLNSFESMDTSSCLDTEFLNRIIRNGGFIKYIEKLERHINA